MVYRLLDWMALDLLPATAAQRDEWFRNLREGPAAGVVERLSNYLPSLLDARHAAALRRLARSRRLERVLRAKLACAFSLSPPT